MDRTMYLQRYWNYYSKLENDCISLSQYVEFRNSNFSTCSNIIISQLLSAGAEFDHLCKIVCGLENHTHPNITNYATYLLSNVKDLLQIKVHVQGTLIDLLPFDSWDASKPKKLFWWEAYNNVKHNREQYYEAGNLYNLLSALSALYFLEMYYVRDIAIKSNCCHALDVPIEPSRLFRIIDWKTKYIVANYNFYIDYEQGADGLF